jgi:hypothetical protein
MLGLLAQAGAADAGTPAEEAAELNALPPAAPAVPDNEAETFHFDLRRRVFIETASGLYLLRPATVPAPPPDPTSWQEHFAADARVELSLASGLSLIAGGRAEARAESSLDVPSHEDFRLDVRELYLRFTARSGVLFEAGRINLKSGVAIGRNPTDFFKTKAVVEPLSIDPAALRENRLGTAMVRVQSLWDGGSASFAYAPKLADSRPVYSVSTLPSVEPMFDRTNDAHRLLLEAGVDARSGLSAQALAYLEGTRLSLGMNVTQDIGNAVVAYFEASATRRGGLVHEALEYGKRTGSIPLGARPPIAGDDRVSFRADAVAGLSYAVAGRLTLNVELQFHQAGLSPQEWDQWFDAGAAGTSREQKLLWSVRGYASEQQEMASRTAAFAHFDWPDFGIRNLQLTGLVLLDLPDGSGVAQLAADDNLSDAWSVGALGIFQFGALRSEFGSLSQTAGVLLKVRRYF